METISKIEEYQSKIGEEKSFLLFVKTDNCSVCEGLRPQVEDFEGDYKLPFYLVNAAKVPELAGQLMLFTAPVVILYRHGKEVQRFARFVPIEELRRRLDELEENLDA
ncbi:thioredoxin family protein [Planococcus halocryophilus]|uniref:thioredoxin family protein n=1 Tax=Planococcus halocryophilus TaxID=1215089 RepID=UPI001F0E2AC0|nr:thioredoxin family protein [Planococcus halocryophilus]MCH4825854.1 thioredoxin family protein [Planococcus halocryophilus]